MAALSIEALLTKHLQLQLQEQQEFGLEEDQPLLRKSNDTYKIEDESFIIQDKKSDLL